MSTGPLPAGHLASGSQQAARSPWYSRDEELIMILLREIASAIYRSLRDPCSVDLSSCRQVILQHFGTAGETRQSIYFPYDSCRYTRWVLQGAAAFIKAYRHNNFELHRLVVSIYASRHSAISSDLHIPNLIAVQRSKTSQKFSWADLVEEGSVHLSCTFPEKLRCINNHITNLKTRHRQLREELELLWPTNEDEGMGDPNDTLSIQFKQMTLRSDRPACQEITPLYLGNCRVSRASRKRTNMLPTSLHEAQPLVGRRVSGVSGDEECPSWATTDQMSYAEEETMESCRKYQILDSCAADMEID